MTDSIFHADSSRPGAAVGPVQQRLLRPSSTGLPDGKHEEVELQKACREFESVFIAFLLKEMRATVDKSGLMDGGKSEELYHSLMDTEVARKLSSAGGIGLAKMLIDQLIAKRGGQSNSPGDSAAETGAAGSQRPLKIR